MTGSIKNVIDRWASSREQVPDIYTPYFGFMPFAQGLSEPFHGYYSTRELSKLPNANRLRYIPSSPHYRHMLEQMAEHGFTRPIRVNIGKNRHAYVYDGNHRVHIACVLGIETIPVLFEFMQTVDARYQNVNRCKFGSRHNDLLRIQRNVREYREAMARENPTMDTVPWGERWTGPKYGYKAKIRVTYTSDDKKNRWVGWRMGYGHSESQKPSVSFVVMRERRQKSVVTGLEAGWVAISEDQYRFDIEDDELVMPGHGRLGKPPFGVAMLAQQMFAFLKERESRG